MWNVDDYCEQRSFEILIIEDKDISNIDNCGQKYTRKTVIVDKGLFLLINMEKGSFVCW